MRVNPEFRRNISVQFTWARLIATPLATLIVCYGYLLLTGYSYRRLEEVATLVGGGVIVGLWGTRRAADSLAEEVSGGTWESQRMSGLGAWQMTWGKLLGSAGFVWYCAAIAMIVVFWTSNRLAVLGRASLPASQVVFEFVIGGIMAQAAAFAVALVLMRKTAQHRRLTITLAQSCGFLLYFFLVRGGFSPRLPMRADSDPDWSIDAITWYGHLYDLQTFRMAVVLAGCLWAVLAAYRLMRLELQYRSMPWVWSAFLVFVIFCAAGFDPVPQLGYALLALVLLTYIAFFADHRDPVRYRWTLVALRSRDWAAVFGGVPWWLISYALAIVLVIAVVIVAPAGTLPPDVNAAPALQMVEIALEHLSVSLVLVMLFMLRDLLVLLWFSCSPWRAKADVAGIIYLALIYWPLAAVLWVTDAQSLLPVVVPISTGNYAVDFVPIGIELVFALFLFLARWREITRLRTR
jgi:hypothetical protein